MSKTQSWYDIRPAAKARAADVYLYDEIGYWGISATDFVAQVARLDVDEINLYLNSPGGEIWDGMAIFNVLKRHKAVVTGTVDGIAASMASVILQAADKRLVAEGSTVMIHDPWIVAAGPAELLREKADQLDKNAADIAEIYADRGGDTPEEWRARMSAESWYRAGEAVAAGLADATVAAVGGAKNLATRAFNLSKFKNVPEWAPKAADPPQIDPPKPEITPSAPEKWPLLAHHYASGAVDVARMRVALARAHNINITLADRENAIRHLEAHARLEGVSTAA